MKVAAAMAGSGHPQGYLERLMSKGNTCCTVLAGMVTLVLCTISTL